jgi:regulator of sigma E protease
VGTTITNLIDGFPNEGPDGLLVGDRILSINGERLYYVEDFTLFMQINTGSHVDLVINRGGEKVTLNNFPLERREYNIDGEMRYRYGITFNAIEATAGEQFKFACYQAYSFARMIRVSVAMLFSGAAGMDEISGPVGIVDAMNTIGQQAPTTIIALGNIIFFMAFLGVNIAIVNLLPIPAMDGGRILFIFITWVIETITRRRLDPKYEGYINTGSFVLLIGLMVIILYNDIMRIISNI